MFHVGESSAQNPDTRSSFSLTLEGFAAVTLQDFCSGYLEVSTGSWWWLLWKHRACVSPEWEGERMSWHAVG